MLNMQRLLLLLLHTDLRCKAALSDLGPVVSAECATVAHVQASWS